MKGWYAIEYRHEGATWAVDIWAESFADAEARIDQLQRAKLKGRSDKPHNTAVPIENPMFAPVPYSMVAAAAASDLSDELTIIRNVLDMALRQEEIGREDLLAADAAAIKARWTVERLTDWAAKQGARPSAITLTRLLEIAR